MIEENDLYISIYIKENIYIIIYIWYLMYLYDIT